MKKLYPFIIIGIVFLFLNEILEIKLVRFKVKNSSNIIEIKKIRYAPNINWI